MTKPGLQGLDTESIRAIAAASPLRTATGLMIMSGFVVAMLFSAGYAVGKDRALADNRADQEQQGR